MAFTSLNAYAGPTSPLSGPGGRRRWEQQNEPFLPSVGQENYAQAPQLSPTVGRAPRIAPMLPSMPGRPSEPPGGGWNVNPPPGSPPAYMGMTPQLINGTNAIGEASRLRNLPNFYPSRPATVGRAYFRGSDGKEITREINQPALPERPVAPDILAARTGLADKLEARGNALMGPYAGTNTYSQDQRTAGMLPGMVRAQTENVQSQTRANDAGVEGFKQLQTDYAALLKRFEAMETEFKKLQGGPPPMTPAQIAADQRAQERNQLDRDKFAASTQPSNQPATAAKAPPRRGAVPSLTGGDDKNGIPGMTTPPNGSTLPNSPGQLSVGPGYSAAPTTQAGTNASNFGGGARPTQQAPVPPGAQQTPDGTMIMDGWEYRAEGEQWVPFRRAAQ